MSIRNGLLALLRRGASHGYQLRTDFEAATGSAWPLNVGQVYTTLARLERDGLVAQEGDADEASEPRVVYRLTEAGDREVDAWFAAPLDRRDRPRDELAIKLALALTTPGVDVAAVVLAQRAATVHAMQDLTRLKREAGDDDAWLLVVESMIFQSEAEVRWLDHCEARLVARAGPPGAGRRRAADPPVAAATTDRSRPQPATTQARP